VPKVVDAAARRQELAHAVWRVIHRDGLERASVRNVAREAGLSVGSLRHYFTTQSELLAFSMRLVSERVRGRIQAVDRSGEPRQVIEQFLAELLPLDAERQAEAAVWLAFTGKALVDPTLRTLRDEVYDSLHEAFRQIVEALVSVGLTEPGLDIDVETERLYALVDGLAMHGVLRPDRAPAEHVAAVVARHLDSLVAVEDPRATPHGSSAQQDCASSAGP